MAESILDRALEELSPTTSLFKIFLHLSLRGAMSPSQIAEETGISPGTVRPALRTLLRRGFVTQREDGSYAAVEQLPLVEVLSHLYARLLKG
ncbi:helix-turn-helix transcriptional regulator [Candidatus Bathyarchaeota archaeon]|nr:helix-turn-helix transcriptional regulator [Candidatus Bathyarchaeota archaeon]